MGVDVKTMKGALIDSDINRRKCPSCAGEGAKDPEVTSSPRAEDLPPETLRSYWSGFFKEKVFFSYYRCTGCKLLFCEYYLAPSKLGELYREMSDNTAGIPVACLRKTQEGYFRVLRDHSSLTGDFMELGPDIGLFTELCVKGGAFRHFWLFEPNQAVHPQLREVVKGKAHTLLAEMMNYAEIPDQSLSLVAMVHVLDHLLNPQEDLENIRQKMKPGGILMAVTHDESSWLAKYTKHRWPPYCLQHPQLFNPDSISRLLHSAGYEVREVRRTYNYFPLSYLARHGLWALGIKANFANRPSSFHLPLKLGNIATVARSR